MTLKSIHVTTHILISLAVSKLRFLIYNLYFAFVTFLKLKQISGCILCYNQSAVGPNVMMVFSNDTNVFDIIDDFVYSKTIIMIEAG